MGIDLPPHAICMQSLKFVPWEMALSKKITKPVLVGFLAGFYMYNVY